MANKNLNEIIASVKYIGGAIGVVSLMFYAAHCRDEHRIKEINIPNFCEEFSYLKNSSEENINRVADSIYSKKLLYIYKPFVNMNREEFKKKLDDCQ